MHGSENIPRAMTPPWATKDECTSAHAWDERTRRSALGVIFVLLHAPRAPGHSMNDAHISPSALARAALIALARAAASAHALDPALVCAVVEQESAWTPWAIRYEPGFLARYVAPLFTAGKISATETYARAFSWGLLQVMGQVAREHGFAGASLAELCDPVVGLEYGCRVLAAKLAQAEGNVERALLLWNGGANIHYAQEVQSRLARYA